MPAGIFPYSAHSTFTEQLLWYQELAEQWVIKIIVSHMTTETAYSGKPATPRFIKTSSTPGRLKHRVHVHIYVRRYLKSHGTSAGIQLLSKVGIKTFNGNLLRVKSI